MIFTVDRTLNYGRHQIERCLQAAMPYETVVDLGAGLGADLQTALRVNPQARLLAVEGYEPYGMKLREKGMEVFSLNIEHDKLPFADESIDVIIMNQILEHVKEVFWILHEVSRTLKVGGALVVGVPNLASLHNRLLLMAGEQPTSIQNHSAHLRGYTKKDFTRLLNSGFANGYQLKRFGGSNFYPFSAFIARPLAEMFPTMAWSIFMSWQKSSVYEGGYLEFPVKEKLETNFFLG